MQRYSRQIKLQSGHIFAESRRSRAVLAAGCFVLLICNGCLPFSNNPKPGPDKQSVGMWYGAATGAGAGAATGVEYAGGTFPGAAIGAGLGAIFGMASGLGIDALEEDELRREAEANYLRDVLWAQDVMAEHYRRRLELHPNRDIFPADLFFEDDHVEVKRSAQVLLKGIADLADKQRPWSRILVASYVKAQDPDSVYAKYLASRRAESIAREMVRAGIEPRRIFTAPTPVKEAVLLDPSDYRDRYDQAIEIILLD